MIQLPVMHTTRFSLDGALQKLIDLTWETRRRGNAFQPAQATLARWLNRTERQVRRYLCHLRDLKLLYWKQRGKKQTNVYYLGHDLWRLLCKGRRIPGAVTTHKKDGPVDRETAKRLLAGIVAGLGKRDGGTPNSAA